MATKSSGATASYMASLVMLPSAISSSAGARRTPILSSGEIASEDPWRQGKMTEASPFKGLSALFLFPLQRLQEPRRLSLQPQQALGQGFRPLDGEKRRQPGWTGGKPARCFGGEVFGGQGDGQEVLADVLDGEVGTIAAATSLGGDLDRVAMTGLPSDDGQSLVPDQGEKLHLTVAMIELPPADAVSVKPRPHGVGVESKLGHGRKDNALPIRVTGLSSPR